MRMIYRCACAVLASLSLVIMLACGGNGNGEGNANSPDKTVEMASAAKYAGLQQAKHVLVQLGRVPTSAKWPWEMIKAEKYDDGKDLPSRYVVIGTVEVSGRVLKWSALVMLEEEWKGCMVSFYGQVVWTLPAYAQQLSDAKTMSEKLAVELNEQKKSLRKEEQVDTVDAVVNEEKPAEKINRDDDEKKSDAKREKAAQSRLKLAKAMMKKSRGAARRRLQQIVEKYPNTKAANEAAELLKKLK